MRALFTLSSGLILCISLTGCATWSHFWDRQQIQTQKCAWCSKPVTVKYVQQFYVTPINPAIIPPSKYRVFHVSDTHNYLVKEDPSQAAVMQAMGQDRKGWPEFFWYEELPFCSQRCLQAYKAASVKEPGEIKQRIIIHE